MPNRKVSVTQAEATRYLKALRKAGHDKGWIKIKHPDGTEISLVPGEATEPIDDGDDIDAMIGRVPDALP